MSEVQDAPADQHKETVTGSEEESRLTEKEIKKQEKWEAVHNAVFAFAESRGATSCIHLLYKEFKFQAERDAVRMLLSSKTMLNVKTKTPVEPEQDVDYAEPNCMPIYILVMLALIRGTQKSISTYLGSYNRWKKSVQTAKSGIEDGRAVNGILKHCIEKHIKTSFAEYRSLVFMSDEPGLNKMRGDRFVEWMGDLRDKIYDANEKYTSQTEISRLNGLLRERDNEIARLTGLLRERDNEIARLTGLLRERDNTLVN